MITNIERGTAYVSLTKHEARQLVEAILNAFCSQTDYQMGESDGFVVELED